MPAYAASVGVSISGVRNDHGHVRVTICPKADFLQPHCPWHADVAARTGSVTVTIPNVPPGIYAAQAFHDENDNGTLDLTFLGWPKEGMGFSNDAPMMFGPPRFGRAAFTVAAHDLQIAFALRYY